MGLLILLFLWVRGLRTAADEPPRRKQSRYGYGYGRSGRTQQLYIGRLYGPGLA
jgi:hypothetical protein